MTEPKVVLYTGEGCSLCEEAAEMLRSENVPFETATDPRFKERIPVVEVNGSIVTEGRVSMRPVRAALRRARRIP